MTLADRTYRLCTAATRLRFARSPSNRVRRFISSPMLYRNGRTHCCRVAKRQWRLRHSIVQTIQVVQHAHSFEIDRASMLGQLLRLACPSRPTPEVSLSATRPEPLPRPVRVIRQAAPHHPGIRHRIIRPASALRRHTPSTGCRSQHGHHTAVRQATRPGIHHRGSFARQYRFRSMRARPIVGVCDDE